MTSRLKQLLELKKRLDAKCWDGYKKQGTKKKGDTIVNNCVKEEDESPAEEAAEDTEEKNDMAHTQLHFIVYAAEQIMEYIMNDGEIEEWYQNKLSKVHSEMESLHAYMEGTKRKDEMMGESLGHAIAKMRVAQVKKDWNKLSSVEKSAQLKKEKEASQKRYAEYQASTKETVDMTGCPLLEKLNPSMGISKYIRDFKKSDAPQFKGASVSKRRKMAVAAYLGAKRKKESK